MDDTKFLKRTLAGAIIAIGIQAIASAYVAFLKIPALVDDVAEIKLEMKRRQSYIDNLNKLEGRVSANEERLKALENRK